MKLLKTLLCIASALGIAAAHAGGDEADALYQSYRQKLAQGDLNGAYEALNERREGDQGNVEYLCDQAAFLIEHAEDKSEALPMLEHGISMAQAQNDARMLPRLYELYAGALCMTGDIGRAYDAGQKALSYCDGREPDEELASICQLMLAICQKAGNYQKALDYGLKAYETRCKTDGEDSERAASTLSALSVIYVRLNQIDKASDAIRRSGEIYRKLGIEEPSFYQNKAAVAMEKNDLEDAAADFSKALELSRKSGPADKVVSNLRSLAGVFFRQDKAGETLKCMDEAVSSAASLYGRDSPMYASVLREKGTYERDLRRTADAIRSLKEALRIFDEYEGQRSNESHTTLIEMYRLACLIMINGDAENAPFAKEFMSDKYFVIEPCGRDPAYLLTFGEWKMNRAASIFDYIPQVLENDVEVTYTVERKPSSGST
ncbi:MAG: tetratricopeptide repeat protein, partial [Succinivibrio sp.]